jgi:hypothetical protein
MPKVFTIGSMPSSAEHFVNRRVGANVPEVIICAFTTRRSLLVLRNQMALCPRELTTSMRWRTQTGVLLAPDLQAFGREMERYTDSVAFAAGASSPARCTSSGEHRP